MARHRATVAFYAWDYRSSGMEFMLAFWQMAAALDPGAQELQTSRPLTS